MVSSLHAQNLFSSTTKSVPCCQRFQASLHASTNPRNKSTLSLPILPTLINMKELVLREEHTASTCNQTQPRIPARTADDQLLLAKLRAIAETAADRAEMHAIIGDQRNNWNTLLLSSINSITLTASMMAGIAAMPIGDSMPHLLPMKLSSALLFTAAAGMMLGVNKIQPSQLVEEQRNATRLFKQLERSIQTTLALQSPTELDVEAAMERVLALEKAYPLPLLPGMLEKFPKVVEPTVWWPKLKPRRRQMNKGERNGWSKEIEEEMMGVLRVLKAKDEEQYVRLGGLVLKINRTLAIAGPLLAGLAAVGAGFIGNSEQWPALVAVVGGALATVVNTVEHGGQVGMVFELYRNCAGFYRQLEEEIENNLGEEELEMRENAELFEMKMALHLGRSIPELKDFASYAAASSCNDEDIQEFAGKLF